LSKIYLFARKVATGGTAVMETTIKDAPFRKVSNVEDLVKSVEATR